MRITIKNIYWLARGKIMSNAEIIVVVIFVVIINVYCVYRLLYCRSKKKLYVDLKDMMMDRTIKNGKKK